MASHLRRGRRQKPPSNPPVPGLTPGATRKPFRCARQCVAGHLHFPPGGTPRKQRCRFHSHRYGPASTQSPGFFSAASVSIESAGQQRTRQFRYFHRKAVWQIHRPDGPPYTHEFRFRCNALVAQKLRPVRRPACPGRNTAPAPLRTRATLADGCSAVSQRNGKRGSVWR